MEYVDAKTDKDNPVWTHIPADRIAELRVAYEAWHEAYLKTQGPHLAELTREKNRVRLEAERLMREFVRQFLRGRPVTDLDRDMMGINNWDNIRTPEPVPSTVPEIEANTSVLRRLSLRVRDHGSTSWAKPAHAHSMEIAWGIMEARPGHVGDLPHRVTATSNPVVIDFEEEDRGKRVYFAARWLNNTAQPGPWSDIESAIVP